MKKGAASTCQQASYFRALAKQKEEREKARRKGEKDETQKGWGPRQRGRG